MVFQWMIFSDVSGSVSTDMVFFQLWFFSIYLVDS
jgi:hypothetical protein